MAEHMHLKEEEIAMLAYFVMDWFNYLQHLPEAAVVRVRAVYARSKSNKTPQQVIIDDVVEPLHKALRTGWDVVVTPAMFHMLAAAGIPISAATAT